MNDAYRTSCERCKELEEKLEALKNKPCERCKTLESKIERDARDLINKGAIKKKEYPYVDPYGAMFFAFFLVLCLSGILYGISVLWRAPHAPVEEFNYEHEQTINH